VFDSLKHPLPRALLLDQCKLEQILINLISNAIKFTPEKGHIKIRARWINSDEDTYSNRSDNRKLKLLAHGRMGSSEASSATSQRTPAIEAGLLKNYGNHSQQH
jgi:hypothetical protein